MDPGRVFYITKSQPASGVVYTILDSDSTTRLYTVETSQKAKPHMTLIRHRCPYQQMAAPACHYPSPSPPCAHPPVQVPFGGSNSGTVVSTVSFHGLSSKIGISLYSGPQPMEMTMKRSDLLAGGRKFDSPLGRMQWKGGDSIFTSSQKLVDQHKRVIARYEKRSSLLSRQMDQFILLVQDANVIANLDMVIVTGLATIEYTRRSDKEWDEVLEEVAETVFDV
ncbi:uncharacterized protein CIMG_00784 [Coccidioides immitis RS]|uniref:DUF6593 domain-containing protein n=3 Tax=Coccidioides immitis TaxID=5501 RepID=J3KHR0_COCIM|nr:uncharacterized protein CIMG_00784 [Coccidioides immitis RS]EAS35430.3 hypothetical protein CIMG_00784 [Coccidioides immitis RS]KMP00676.1 hypothetical protein CIRG_00818 [Coccidioides immitis RMSCC 2394]KMU78205.1 hypothetical protein CISG_07045 [Coccidioides immitis RMSCC 3703]TPX26307.1 hypothetical protein DIZ76_011769 [Coccidioides immitis]